MAKNLKNVTPIYEDPYGVCLWMMPGDGGILGDEDNNYLSLEGRMNDPIVEEKVRRAAVYHVGDEAGFGTPLWINGSRRCSEEEYAQQLENLENGIIPDVVDELKQAGVKEFK